MRENQTKRTHSRRAFLELTAATAGAWLLQSCATPAQPAPTQAPAAAATKAPSTAAPAATSAPPAATKAATQAAATPAPAATPKRGGTFTLAMTAGVVDFNPYNLSAGNVTWTRAVYSTPMYCDRQLNLYPGLAEKWDVSADGKSLTLKLKEGVKFHSGRELTAEDIKFSAEYARTDNAVFMRSLFTAIEGVDVLDKYRPVIKFKNVYPGMFDLMVNMWIIDKDAVAKFPNAANGTGPFVVDKYIPNDRAEFIPFKDYWEKGKPYIDRFIVRVVPDPSAMVIALETGAADAIWRPAVREAARLKQDPRWVVSQASNGMYNLSMNVEVPPFNNKKVRQAMAWAIDRPRFVNTTLQGLMQPTCLMWPQSSWGYLKDLEGKIGFDLEKAKALLKEAGFEKGFETEMLTSQNRSYGFGELAQIIQADLAKIGVTAKVQDVEPALYETRMKKGDFKLMVHSYGRAHYDPGTLVTAAVAWYTKKEGGWCMFESAEYDKLRADLQSTLDKEKRLGICRKIQEMMLDEAFCNPISELIAPWAWSSRVKDLVYNQESNAFVGDLWLA